MIPNSRLGLIAMAAFSCLCSGAIASESPLGASASQLLAKDLPTQFKGLEELRIGRDELVSLLTSTIEDVSADPLVRTNAIVNAGIYRVSEAIDPLIGLLSFVAAGNLPGSRSVGSVYPAVGALIQIGSPVPDRLLKALPRLAKPIDDDSIQKIATILIAIDGQALTMLRIEAHLKRIISDESASQAANRIKEEVSKRSP
jgi:hypothetical protein